MPACLRDPRKCSKRFCGPITLRTAVLPAPRAWRRPPVLPVLVGKPQRRTPSRLYCKGGCLQEGGQQVPCRNTRAKSGGEESRARASRQDVVPQMLLGSCCLSPGARGGSRRARSCSVGRPPRGPGGNVPPGREFRHSTRQVPPSTASVLRTSQPMRVLKGRRQDRCQR